MFIRPALLAAAALTLPMALAIAPAAAAPTSDADLIRPDHVAAADTPQAAAAVLAILPTMAMFAFASRWIVEGLTAGAVKE